MNEAWEKILDVYNRYQEYFKACNADIALSVKGTHFFTVYDEKHEDYEVFTIFHTAEELEYLILGTLAEDLECINAVAVDNLHYKFEEIDADNTLEDYDPGYHMSKLYKQLEAMTEEQEHWSEMLSRTYRALRDIGENLQKK